MSGEEEEIPVDVSAQWHNNAQNFEPSVMGINSSRRMIQARQVKRIVPEDLKDEKYWEKRKKNNMAAKRSRESRRQNESEIRLKIELLEKENMLLKKEVSVMKSKFGIPPEHSMLTCQEKLDCLQMLKESRTSIGREEDFRESPECSERNKNCLNVPIMTGSKNRRLSSDYEDERMSLSCSEYAQPMPLTRSVDGVVWSTGTEQQPQIEQSGNDRRFTMKMQNLNPYGQIAPYHYETGQACHEQGFYMGINRKQAHISADLFITKSHDLRNGSSSVPVPFLHRGSPNTNGENGQGYPKSVSSRSTPSEGSDVNADKLDKQELKRKIMQLSAQCEEMKDFVFKK